MSIDRQDHPVDNRANDRLATSVLHVATNSAGTPVSSLMASEFSRTRGMARTRPLTPRLEHGRIIATRANPLEPEMLLSPEARPQRKPVIVADPRSFVRGCLSCWLDEFGGEFVPVLAENIADPGINGMQSLAVAAILSAPGSDFGRAWLEEQIAQLRGHDPQLPIIMILDEPDTAAGQDIAVSLDLQGYIPMTSSLEVAAAALRLVIAGGNYYPSLPGQSHTNAGTASAATRAEPAQANGKLHLTPREQSVYELLAKGLPNKIIAHRLGLAISTVKIHVHHIIEKLKVQNRTEVAIWGRETAPLGSEPRQSNSPQAK